MNWFPKRRVIAPVDFSDESLAAVDTALQLVDSPSDLTIVHVLQDLSPIEPGEIWRAADKDTRRRHTAQALRERLADDKYEAVRVEIRFGDPGHEIASFAGKQGAELIVLPSHGRTGLKHLLIGSVAERIVRLAHCPVLVLRS